MLVDERGSLLAARLARQVKATGAGPSPVEDVRIIYTTEHHARTPVMYEPCIIIVFQGYKVGYLGEQMFRYDPNNYLLMTLPLPCECETFASPEEPLVGISLRVNTAVLQELMFEMGDGLEDASRRQSPGFRSVALNEALFCAAERLIDAMEDPLEARVLGPQIVREMLFYVLRGEGGEALQALVNRHGHFSQIAKALRVIEQQYTSNLNIDLLAQEVNMSISAFHHNFKAVTSTSPLQYIKSYRLHKARMLMLHDGLKASTAAIRVGYESPSQFSREYKRFFGNTPSEQVARYREGGLVVER